MLNVFVNFFFNVCLVEIIAKFDCVFKIAEYPGFQVLKLALPEEVVVRRPIWQPCSSLWFEKKGEPKRWRGGREYSQLAGLQETWRNPNVFHAAPNTKWSCGEALRSRTWKYQKYDEINYAHVALLNIASKKSDQYLCLCIHWHWVVNRIHAPIACMHSAYIQRCSSTWITPVDSQMERQILTVRGNTVERGQSGEQLSGMEY